MRQTATRVTTYMSKNVGCGIFRSKSFSKNSYRKFSASSVQPLLSTYDWTKGPLTAPALMMRHHVGISDPVSEKKKVATILTEDQIIMDVLVPKLDVGSSGGTWFVKYNADKGEYIPAGSFPVTFYREQPRNTLKQGKNNSSSNTVVSFFLGGIATLCGVTYTLGEGLRSLG